MTSSVTNPPTPTASTSHVGCNANTQLIDTVVVTPEAIVDKQPQVRGRSRSPRKDGNSREDDAQACELEFLHDPPWAHLRRRKRISRSSPFQARLKRTPRPLVCQYSVVDGSRCRSSSSSNTSGACSPPPSACSALGLDARRLQQPPTPPPPSRPWREKRGTEDIPRRLRYKSLSGAKHDFDASEATEIEQAKQESLSTQGIVVGSGLVPLPPPPPPPLASGFVPPPPVPTKRPPLDPKDVCPRGMGICLRGLIGICKKGSASCHNYHPSWRTAAQIRAFLANIPCKHGAECVMQRRHCLFRHENKKDSVSPSKPVDIKPATLAIADFKQSYSVLEKEEENGDKVLPYVVDGVASASLSIAGQQSPQVKEEQLALKSCFKEDHGPEVMVPLFSSTSASPQLAPSVKEETPPIINNPEAKAELSQLRPIDQIATEVLSSDGEGLVSSDGEASPPRMASPSLESGQTVSPRSLSPLHAYQSPTCRRASIGRSASPSLESGEASPPRFDKDNLLPGATWLPKKEQRKRASSRDSRCNYSSTYSRSEYSGTSSSSSVSASEVAFRHHRRSTTVRPRRSADSPPLLPSRQFLQQKVEPAPLFESPSFLVVSKPAGWEVGPAEPLGSGVVDLDDYLRSGWVEPMRAYFALPRTAWHPVISPSALASGWALIARGKRARSFLDQNVSTGQLQTLSLALVKGQAFKERAFAQSNKGVLEISVLVKYWHTNEDSWTGKAGMQQYTLLALRASGNACGIERSLLKLAWGSAACGDIENAGGVVHAAPETQGHTFFHYWGLAMPDPWHDNAGLSIVCPLPSDLRCSLAAMCCEPEASSIHQLLLSSRAEIPPEVSGCTLPAPVPMPQPAGTVPEPAPFGAEIWQKGSCSRRRWIIAFCEQVARRWSEFGLKSSPTGELRIDQIFRRFDGLRDACWGNPQMLSMILAKKDPTKAFVVDAVRNVIRRRTATERLQVFVETYAMHLPPAAKVTVAELLQNGHIQTLLHSSELPKQPILESLMPCAFFVVDLLEGTLVMRPLQERMRLIAEQLLTFPDQNISGKMTGSHGKVPLAWLLGNYSYMLMGERQPGQSLPIISDFAAALQASALLSVDPQTLSVSLKWEYGEGVKPMSEVNDLSLTGLRKENTQLKPSLHDGKLEPSQQLQSYKDVLKEPSCNERVWGMFRFAKKVSTQMVKAMAGLLNHYFQPFNLQNNRLLLHSAEFGEETGTWQWSMHRLAQEINRVGVIYSPLSKPLRKKLLEQVSVHLRSVRLRWRSPVEEPLLELTYTPDFRQPVLRPIGTHEWAKSHFLKAREFVPTLPPFAAVVMSYALDGGETGSNANHKAHEKRCRFVLRQLLAYAPDVICLQQCKAYLVSARSCHEVVAPSESLHDVPSASLDAQPLHNSEGTLFAAICERLEREDYEWCAAPARLQCANAVFWRRSIWKAVSWSASPIGCVVATLERQMMPKWELCIASTSSLDGQDVAWQLEYLKARLPASPAPSLLCGAFGVDSHSFGASLKRQGLRSFRSAHAEVLGKELPWTTITADADVAALSSNDGIWIGGGSNTLNALAVLGGHAQEPIRSANGQICRNTFPTNHLPLIAVVEQRPLPPSILDSGSQFQRA